MHVGREPSLPCMLFRRLPRPTVIGSEFFLSRIEALLSLPPPKNAILHFPLFCSDELLDTFSAVTFCEGDWWEEDGGGTVAAGVCVSLSLSLPLSMCRIW